MSEENTGGSAPTWSEGGPVESMSVDDAKAEIQAIEGSPDFLGEGKLAYWPRQNMLKRRDTLYRHVSGEAGEKEYSPMADTLNVLGVTEETLKADQERFVERDFQEVRQKSMDTLITHFGGENEAKQAILQARGVLRRFAGPADLDFLEDSGLADDPELIQKLAEIGQIFKRANEKARNKK